MATLDKKISQFTTATTLSDTSQALITLVDETETVASNRNKKMTVDNFKETLLNDGADIIGNLSVTGKVLLSAVTNAGDIQLKRGRFIGFSNADDDANSEYIYANGGNLEFGIAGSTRATLDTAGNLSVSGEIIGLQSSYFRKTINTPGTSGNTVYENLLGSRNSVNNVDYVTIQAGNELTSNARGYLRVRVNEAQDEGFDVDYLGNLSVTGAITPTGGLQLGGSTSANLLDDYEEGTWTPTLTGSTTTGVGTYTVQVGKYRKVGKLVTVTAEITWTAQSGAGDMSISGIPFSALSEFRPVTLLHSGLNVADLRGLIIANVITLRNQGSTSFTNVAIETSGTIYLTATYLTA